MPMEQKTIDVVFRRRGNVCVCAKAAKQLSLLNEPELERFFSASNQQEIVRVLTQAKGAMKRYRDLKAHDYVIEDFSDDCASRLYFASEMAYRPEENELRGRIERLFALKPEHLNQVKTGNRLWISTLKHWVRYTNRCWLEMFGHKTVFLPKL